jgi:hypothetical protein
MLYINITTLYIKHIVYKYFIYFLPMSFFDLNNDIKSIISKHLSDDYKISAKFKHLFHDYNISTQFMSKQYDLQKSLFGEIVFDDDFHKIKTHLVV